MEGLRNIIIKVDNHRAPDVDHLNGGTRSSEVRGTKVRRGVLRHVNQGRSRVIDAKSGGSWLSESVHQCWSRCGGLDKYKRLESDLQRY